MSRRTTLTTMLLCSVIALPADNAVAQQKQQVSWKAPAEISKYTQQLNIDVGDVPNHIVRINEIHRTYSNNAPVISGLKLVEEWDRTIADYIDTNGSGTTYIVYVMENGDRFFARAALLVQNTRPLSGADLSY